MGKLIIVRQETCLLLLLMDSQRRPQVIRVASLPDEEENTGNIYVGRVADVHSGIHAAFVTFDQNLSEHLGRAFLPLDDCKEPMLLNRSYDGRLKQGDELLVQIKTPALKTKQPVGTTKLSLTGQYCVCKRDGHGVSCSGKLEKQKAAALKEAVKGQNIPGRGNYHFIIRTNAGDLADLTPLFEEMKDFIHFFQNLEQIYQHRSLYSCLYRTEPELLKLLKDMPVTAYEEIVTEEPELYELIKGNVGEKSVRLYQDELLPLGKLYSVETHLREALGKKVWLKCGGYLIIEPTEAMVVIDVNSGKAENRVRQDQQAYFYKVNLEAAGEVARQLRLRNYSGMIMVDFINMESEEDKRALLSCLDGALREDRVSTRLVDMTPLGIVEITRKKVSRPLADFYNDTRDFREIQ